MLKKWRNGKTKYIYTYIYVIWFSQLSQNLLAHHPWQLTRLSIPIHRYIFLYILLHLFYTIIIQGKPSQVMMSLTVRCGETKNLYY